MIRCLKEWMLPIAIAVGIAFCLLMHYAPLPSGVEPLFSAFAKDLQPVLIAVMLFLQFNKISPHDLKFRKWHFILLAMQMTMFLVLTAAAMLFPDGSIARILSECAMLCFICPTAAAAGVITGKLGGSLSDTISYVVLINIAVAVTIPVVIPIFNTDSGVSFFTGFRAICMKVFPLLVLPMLLAWTVRYTCGRLQRKLIRYADWAFYFWGMALCLSIYLATKALVTSGISFGTAVLIGLVSLAATVLQFIAGRTAGAACSRKDAASHASDRITAGQALGQKNTGFLIWLGYSYLTPVTSVAGGLYSIWQNIINSLELYLKAREDERSRIL